jgi:hypothetical protein
MHLPNLFQTPRTQLVILVVSILGVAAGAAMVGDEDHLFMDVHHLGPGNVTAEAVAEAHRKDLAIQESFDVDYQRYWVDETEGTVYCLVRAPSPEAAAEVHRRAHGLVADEIVEVQPGILPAAPGGERKLFMDTHLAGPGAIRGEDVAEAHRKDLEVQDDFGVRFLEYWYDEDSGKIHCLAEAPDADSVRAAHEKAHGMVPDEILEVTPGQ